MNNRIRQEWVEETNYLKGKAREQIPVAACLWNRGIVPKPMLEVPGPVQETTRYYLAGDLDQEFK
eukprot:9077385-Heterocapsa_arctica.AAC.1